MLRTGQSLLANSLIHLHLGRSTYAFHTSASHSSHPLTFLLVVVSVVAGWRRPLEPPSPLTASPKELADYATYVRIVSWFMDDPSPYAPFSVHRMALVGKQLGKEVGEWFGPSTAAGAIRSVCSYV